MTPRKAPIPHSARSGNGVQVKSLYKYLIEKTITKLPELKIVVLNVGADTAMHGLLVWTKDKKTNNLIGIKNYIYSFWKKNGVKNLQKELIKRLPEEEAREARLNRPEYSKMNTIVFRELGDFRDDQILSIIGEETLENFYRTRATGSLASTDTLQDQTRPGSPVSTGSLQDQTTASSLAPTVTLQGQTTAGSLAPTEGG